MRRIPLGVRSGKPILHVLVDDRDYKRVSQFAWHAHVDDTNIYACRREVEMVNGELRSRKIYMHRWILDVWGKDVIVDHRDRNGLNNTRNNLNKTDHSGNNKNRTTGMAVYSKIAAKRGGVKLVS